MKFVLPVLLLAFCITSFGQQTQRDRAITLFKQGDLNAARKIFEQQSKADRSDAESRNYLGLIDMRKKDYKKARQNLEKAVELDPNDQAYRVNLAYLLVLTGDGKKARTLADQVLSADPQNLAAYYVRGKAALGENDVDAASADAEKALAIEPLNQQANILKADALFQKYVDTVRRNYTLKSEVDTLRLAVQTIDNCLLKCPKNSETAALENRRDIIGAFLDAAERKPANIDPEEPMETPDPANRRLKILSKEPASYTEDARKRGVSGTVRLMILFGADGNIPYIIVLKSLDPDLDRQAVNAARRIKFEPRMRAEKPVSTAAIVEYGFTIY